MTGSRGEGYGSMPDFTPEQQAIHAAHVMAHPPHSWIRRRT